jgi:hypothetical protein
MNGLYIPLNSLEDTNKITFLQEPSLKEGSSSPKITMNQDTTNDPTNTGST